MIEIIISGIGFGVVLSIIGGPVFFVLIKTSIEKGFYAGISLASGVLLSDIIFITLVIYGSSYLEFQSQYRLQISMIGSAILLGIGIYYLFKKTHVSDEDDDDKPSKRYHTFYFLKGFFMCIFNPGVLFYWINIASVTVSVVGDFEAKDLIAFFSSILITQFSLDVAKVHYANKLRHHIKDELMSKLNKVAGVLMILFAAKIIVEQILGHPLI